MSTHCPGCRNSDPTPQGVDPLGVMRKPFGFCVRCQKDEQYCECDSPLLEPPNPSHGTMSKTAPHIALEQLRALGGMKKLPTLTEQRRADRTLRRMLRAMRPKK